MDHFDRRELERLVQTPPGTTVSILLPTHRAGPETQQDPIRLKNALRSAAAQLAEQGVSDADVGRWLRPAEALLGDQEFWQHQREGLALFLRSGEMDVYRVPRRVEERVVVDKRPYLKPLLPILSGDGSFFVLALSQHDIRLLEASAHSLDEVELERVPKSIHEVFAYNDPEQHLQLRRGRPGTPSTGAAVFHGHAPKEDAKVDILGYFRSVAAGIEEILNGRQEPLVLAGVEFLQPIYREANRYPHLLERGVEGSPELLRSEELHAKAWEIVAPVFEKAEAAARAKYDELDGTGRTAKDVAEVVSAAHHGKVETLFVALGEERWGRYDPERDSLEQHDTPAADAQDLLELATSRTLLTSGTVYAVPPERVPKGDLVAAVFRY